MTQEEKIRLGKLYKRYNQCRDAELDRFWKNSVFVWVFLALCFAAFGSLFKDHNMPTKAMDIANTSNETYYLSLSVISLIACILSWIWVWMARGLKAWYEVYETAIWDIESFKNEFAKSLQSCPTLCDPRDGSPPGSPVPGILQARTPEWVAISFSNA